MPTGLVDGPLPAHYEPVESPVHNPLYKQQSSPVLKWWARNKPYNVIAPVGDPRYPVHHDDVPAHRALSVRRR